MTHTTHNKLILGLLCLIFTVPSLLGIGLFLHPHWLNAPTINKGQLVTPPIVIHPPSTTSKWHVILWYPGACTQTCRKQMAQLSQIQLALGRQFYQVDISLAQSKQISPIEILPKNIASFTVPVTTQPVLSAFQKPTVFIVDPHDQWILSYPVPVIPNDVFKDIKHLLTVNPASQSTHATHHP